MFEIFDTYKPSIFKGLVLGGGSIAALTVALLVGSASVAKLASAETPSDEALFDEAERTFGLTQLETLLAPADELIFECGGSADIEITIPEIRKKLRVLGKSGYINCSRGIVPPDELKAFCAEAKNQPKLPDGEPTAFTENAKSECERELRVGIGRLGLSCRKPASRQCRIDSCKPFPDTRNVKCKNQPDTKTEYSAKVIRVHDYACEVACEVTLVRPEVKEEVTVGCSECE